MTRPMVGPRCVGLLILCALGACNDREAPRPSQARHLRLSAPPPFDSDWLVADGPLAPANGQQERCEQWTNSCEKFCSARDQGDRRTEPPPLTDAQVSQLSAIVVQQTLSQRASWILLAPTSRGGSAAIENAIASRLQQQYRIYTSDRDLPSEYVQRQGDSWIGYVHGYRFRYQLDFLESSRVRIWTKSTYGAWGCNHSYRLYRWEGSQYRIACVSPVSDEC